MDKKSIGETRPDRQAVILKRAGQSSITLFVVFVIVLSSFGKAPWTRTPCDGGSYLNFNLISCLGVAVGFYAFFFLIFRFRILLNLARVKKILGLIGGFGLIIHLLFALLMPLSYGAGHATVETAGFSPMARSGPEEWQINGKTYPIESTYYLALPEGIRYTIDYPCDLSSEAGCRGGSGATATFKRAVAGLGCPDELSCYPVRCFAIL